MSDKPKGWFSRRHETNAAHLAAVAHHANRPARRVAERAEREAYNTQRCGHEGCTLVRRGHVWLATRPNNRRYPDHEFVEPTQEPANA